MKIKALISGLIWLIVAACGQNHQISKEAHLEEINDWHEKQMASLTSETGWLNLIGLHWLEEGFTSFGSGDNMDFKLEAPHFPEEIGKFEWVEDRVFFIPEVQGVMAEDVEIQEKTLIFDANASVSQAISFGSLHWTIIKRSDAYGVRLRDYEAEIVTSFTGVDRFPVALQWRLIADFVPYLPAKEIPITNVIGQTSPNLSPGYIEFQWEGESYRIDALGNEGDKELFLIFADETSGVETYGGGRYMYVKRPDASGKIILDFNKAYNPPCVYTPYATCPLPPRQNILNLAIRSGHKNYGHH
ncbi:DUF1684 domain-containing protein [Cecembia lonarensis]|uniref:DUF1684 domain-containing protein n=1 Tax=Cecembia lonarensis (strain CCUG 58316 / KCTC 22772 / LW9) TaxID=1225176 RepID=K1M093_CECL9|nr:DUF1684 domain-containing protein [Cecembia lonarensis]EKB49739.1 hypothetical protein B879_01646 [Cecembia lonarensis LW9]